MNTCDGPPTRELVQRLSEAEATIEALLSGQVDAIVDPRSSTPLLLSKAQDALRESVERYRILFEKSPMPKWLYDTETLRFLEVNDAAVRHYGYSREEFLSMTIGDIRPPEDRAVAAREVSSLKSGPAAFGIWKHKKKDGTLIDVDVSGHTLTLDDRTTLLIVALDITERRRTEEALRKSEEQYRHIVEHTVDGIVKLDMRQRLLFVNRRFAEMLGYEPADMIGASLFDYMSPAAKAQAQQSFRGPASQAEVRIDSTLRHKNGTDVSVNVAGSRLLDERGKTVGYLGMIRDVTEQRKLQSQLMVSDRMASVGTLAAGVAHEINNPLAIVIANLDYVAENVGRLGMDDSGAKSRACTDPMLLEEITKSLEDAREASERVRFIVRDLRIFSRSPAEEPHGPVDVTAVIESSLRMGWTEIRHRAKLVKSYADVPPVEANEARLGQVFLNLIVNAAQALPEGRAEKNEVRVGTRRDGERVVVEVSDTGAGIPPEIIGRVFDAFFTTKAVGVGTGLGLAICHRIVADIGGELTVESELGKGTTFRVSLPVARDSERMTVAPVEPMAVPGRRGRILVVDDDVVVATIVKRVLSKEHDVVALVAAADALALCESGEEFDLILCDLMMPDMTGMDFHHELSRVCPAQARRMIFMTGGAFTAAAQRFLSETQTEHLEKPFRPSNLRAIVHRYLR